MGKAGDVVVDRAHISSTAPHTSLPAPLVCILSPQNRISGLGVFFLFEDLDVSKGLALDLDIISLLWSHTPLLSAPLSTGGVHVCRHLVYSGRRSKVHLWVDVGATANSRGHTGARRHTEVSSFFFSCTSTSAVLAFLFLSREGFSSSLPRQPLHRIFVYPRQSRFALFGCCVSKKSHLTPRFERSTHPPKGHELTD